MEFLFNPNVAYLILVAGFVISTLALFAPGTGLLEIAGLFTLALAGYGIYNNAINLWALLLLVIGVFPFLIALRQSRRWIFMIISLLAMAVGSAYLFQSDAWWKPGVHPLLALFVSLIFSGLAWVIARRSLEAMERKPIFNMKSLVGAVGVAVTEIHKEGSAYVAGENWSARSPRLIPAKTRVRVVSREGFVLDVEPVEEQPPKS